METEKKHLYMVKQEKDLPTLLCIYPDEEHGTYQYNITMYPHAAWVYAPELNDILTHKDRFPEFHEASDAEVEEAKKVLNAELDRREEEKNVIHSDHKQMDTVDGIVDIDIYFKEDERRCFRSIELEKLLHQWIDPENVTVQDIRYSRYDYWGYLKLHNTKSKSDISDICDMPKEIDGYFMDDERKYRFRYLSRKEVAAVASCPRQLPVDLHSVFDDE